MTQRRPGPLTPSRCGERLGLWDKGGPNVVEPGG